MNISDKKKLLKRKSELEQNLLNLRTKEIDLDADSKKKQIVTLEASLITVDQAMKRLEEDLYGYCIVCDDEIDKRILMKYPETLICKDCETLR